MASRRRKSEFDTTVPGNSSFKKFRVVTLKPKCLDVQDQEVSETEVHRIAGIECLIPETGIPGLVATGHLTSGYQAEVPGCEALNCYGSELKTQKSGFEVLGQLKSEIKPIYCDLKQGFPDEAGYC